MKFCQSAFRVGKLEKDSVSDEKDIDIEFGRCQLVKGWNVTFNSREAARLAVAMSMKEVVVKGPHKV